jgi:tRNA A-37 threonylcarbamoyl transferase component Bud32
MSGKTFSWIIAEEFKNKFTPDQLAACIAKNNTSPDIEFFRSGNSRTQALRFHQAWQTAQALQSRNINFRRPIALGLRKQFGYMREACLAVEIIPGSIPLKDYIDRFGPRPSGLKLPEGRDLTDLFIGFSAQLRAACVLPVDFNLGDVLLRATEDGSPALHLADAGRLAPKRATAGRNRIDSLLMLDAVLWGKAPSRHQLLFARMYQRSFSRWLRALGLRCIDLASELRFFSLAAPDRPSTRCFRSGDLQGCLWRGPCENALVKMLENPDSLFSRPDAVILKNSATTTALLVQLPELPFPIYLKRYNSKGRLFGLKYLLRRSRARRAWSLAQKIEGRNTASPEVLAFADCRRFGLLKAAYLITRGIARPESLDEYIEKNFPRWGTQKKNMFVQRVAAMLRAVHALGLVHGDLKAKNILAAPEGEHEKLWLIDLDAARLRKHPALDECRSDIARLNCSFLNTSRISRTQRLRFLQAYVQDEGELRQAWRSIWQHTEKKLRKAGRAFTGCTPL